MEVVRFRCFLVILLSVCLLAGDAVRSTRKRKVKKVKLIINPNDPFYSAPFDPCKKTRYFNPVELVKAQAFSAKLFQKCAATLIVEFASRSGFPAWGKSFLNVLFLT